MTSVTEYKTPLGTKTTDPEALRHWNRLADAIASKGWIHHSTDDRYGTICFTPTQPTINFLHPRSGGVEVLHVEHALALYERIYGRAFSEDP